MANATTIIREDIISDRLYDKRLLIHRDKTSLNPRSIVIRIKAINNDVYNRILPAFIGYLNKSYNRKGMAREEEKAIR